MPTNNETPSKTDGTESPATPERPSITADPRLSLKDVDFQPPLVECLAAISRLLNKPVSVATLKAGLPQQDGLVTAASIIRAADKIGISARTVHRPALENISSLVLPCILLLKGGNACVLLSMDKKSAVIISPGHGDDPREVSHDQLTEEYTGYAILTRLKEKLDKRASEIRLIKQKRWFWDTLFRFWPIYRHVISASVITNIIVIASPLFVMNVYDRVIPNNATETLWALAIGIVLAYLFDFLLKNLRGYFVDVAGRNADVLIGSRLMQHLMSARLDYLPKSAGAIANNIREFETLREFFSSTTLVAFIDLPFLLLFLVVIYYIGGTMALPLLVAVPVVALAGLFLQIPLQRVMENSYKESTQKHAMLYEIVHGLETIKTCLAQGRIQAKWENVVGMSAHSTGKAKILANLALNLSAFSGQMVSVAVIILGVYKIHAGELTVGGLIACNILSARALAPLGALAGLLTRFQQSRMALFALNMLMELPSERPEEMDTFGYGEIKSSIAFKGVKFNYPGASRAVLDNISFSISPGEKVGVVGRIGAGKTTLGKLCVGLYQPLEGSVQVGSIDLRQMDVADLRKKIGYVSQDSLLFYGSLKENIAFGLPEADDESIRNAAEIAGVTQFIKDHPAGFAMNVGERGSELSGGQRQAISIARALLAGNDMLVMDEPTSNMDAQTEFTLKQRLIKHLGDKTLILITHRPSLLELVDRLIVLEGGRIVADGLKADVVKWLQTGKTPTSK